MTRRPKLGASNVEGLSSLPPPPRSTAHAQRAVEPGRVRRMTCIITRRAVTPFALRVPLRTRRSKARGETVVKTSCCELSRLPFLSPALSANARPAPAGWGPTRALRVRGAERVRTGSRQSRDAACGRVPSFPTSQASRFVFHFFIHPPVHPSDPSIRHPSIHPSAHSPRCLCRGGPRHSLCSSEPGCDPASHRQETQRTPWPQQELSTHLGSHGRWAPPGGLRAVLQGDSDVPRAWRPGPCAAPLRRLSAGGRHLPPLPWAGGGRGIHTAPGTTALQNLTGSPSPAHGSGGCEVAPSRGRA